MILVFKKGKYEIEYSKAICEDEYSISVFYDNKAIKVRTINLTNGEYKLEIKKAIIYDDCMDITKRELYGKKFKKNFETMKKLLDQLFEEQGVMT